MREYYDDVVDYIKNKKPTKDELSRYKVKLCRKYSMKKIPTDIDILLNMNVEDMHSVGLVTKPTRTGSGVAVVAIMSYPFSCKHGKCIMCPGGPGSVFGDTAQSYTGKEPAALRALRNDYDAYLQVFNRLEQYVAIGQDFSKIELIIMGGTFISFGKRYKDNFIYNAFKAMNDFGSEFFKNGKLDFVKYKQFFEMPGDMKDVDRVKRIQAKIRLLRDSRKSDLVKEQKKNESGLVRVVALAIETRPDYCKKKHIKEMLSYGCTRVELGVQTVYDEILNANNRGHSVRDIVRATRFLKDGMLKVGYHMMPGLYGSNDCMDRGSFKEIFSNSDYKPDALKIYPCMVIEGTELFDLFKLGKFKPMTTIEAAELIASVKQFIPKYCRVMRVQRDIPTYVTCAGVDKTNLRQYVMQVMEKKGWTCNCIRCREPKGIEIGELVYDVQYYTASGSWEVFISANDERSGKLVGFLRMRKLDGSFSEWFDDSSCGVRELHVYGQAVGVGTKSNLGLKSVKGQMQHRGIGKKLMAMAEKIAVSEYGAKRMYVISGIGVREYYRKLGYRLDGFYMKKKL